MNLYRIISIISLFVFSTITASTINIPSDDYPTIQAGIDAAEEGDIILIAQGTYYENLTINKEITIQSSVDFELLEDEEIWYNNEIIQNTIINGSLINDPNKRSCLIIRDGDIQPVIRGLTFEGGVGTRMSLGTGCASGAERSGGGILIYDAYPTINYNRFVNNGISNERGRKNSKNGGAIAHYEDAEVEFDEDRQSAPSSSSSNRTVPGTMDIQNNYFENNSSGNGQDFYSHGFDGSINVSNSVFANIDCETNTVNDFVLNSLDNYADFIQSDISGACIEDADFYVSVNGDNGNNGTESSPFATIGHALSFVKEVGDATTIFVGAGTYSPDLTGEVFPILIPNNVHLIGENAETTILDASADSTNEAAVVIIKEVETVTLKNFTLMNGYSEGHGCSGGGGLLIAADDMYNLYDGDGGTGVDVTSTPLIENLIIENSHSKNGGGLSFFRTHGPILNNVIIRNNTATAFGGGVFSYGGGITMTNVTVTGNQNMGEGQGGGMMLAGTEGTLDNMTITDNTANGAHGGGIWTNSSGDDETGWVMTNSLISGNHADQLGGGITFAWSHPTVINCTISNNTSYWGGGGVSGINSGFTLKETTVSDNWTWNGGGGIFAFGPLEIADPPIIEDCIISGNETENSDGGDGGGILLNDNIDAVINRTSVVNNHAAGYIGGIDVMATTTEITNVTVSGNTSGGGGGIGISDNANVDIINSIVWNNTGTEIIQMNGSVDVTYSDIQDGYTGVGNIDTNPFFIDAVAGDFGLQIDSPCIDTGTADLDQNGVEDISDYIGLAPDMGAFENLLEITAPAAINYTPLAGSIMLTWSAISTSYEFMVEKSMTADFSGDIEEFVVDNNSFTDSDLDVGVEYFYRISAIYGTIVSDPSEVISAMIVPVATGLDYEVQNDQSVTLTWDEDANASNYKIQRSRDPSFFGPSVEFETTENSYNDATLPLSTMYHYRITTYYGEHRSLASENVSLLIVPAPVGITYVIEESSVTLSWDQIEIATNYHIDRATDSLFATNLIEFESETNSFTDNGLEANIDYYYRISAVCCDGDFTSTNSDVVSVMLTVMDVASADNLPESFRLHQNFPNPFNPVTQIRYDLQSSENVSINIYNVIGKHIKSLINENQDAGYQSIYWNATDASGQSVPAGMYIYTIQAGDFRETKKMVLLK